MFYVYHIPNPKDIFDLQQGYVGVTSNVKSRFYQHQQGDLIVGRAIRKYNISFHDVKILFEFEDSKSAFLKEKELRPEIKIGWNIGVGGLGGSRGPCSDEVRHLMSIKMSGKK
jgi:predicted GIY-YIG superfamily endonuclease